MKGDHPPTQELFFANNAGPIERFERYYLRSQGAFPVELHYHHPGDGNLRGYFNQHVHCFGMDQGVARDHFENRFIAP